MLKFASFENANHPVLHIATGYTMGEDGETHLLNEVCKIDIPSTLWNPQEGREIANKRAMFICAAINAKILTTNGGFPAFMHDDPDFVEKE